jgi:acyl-CoA synthetase (AMP-forming)/AMP-acid ligase II/thioesterase domain-containing protein/acyl carrier protein
VITASIPFRSAHAGDNCFIPRPGFRPFDPLEAESTLGERFREVALRRGCATAVIDGNLTLSYTELLERASAIAAKLRARCGAAGGIVAICLPSSLATIETLLGALLGGFGYFCLDPSLPQRQKVALLKAAGPVALEIGELCIGELQIDEMPAVEAGVNTCGPAGVAALYATSGSTGQPKMVALSNRAVLFDIGRQTNDLCLGPDDRFDLLSAFAFSSSLATVFGALLNGAQLHCFDLRQSLTTLPEWLREARITVSTMTVSMLRHICLLAFPATTFSDMRLLSVGGEALRAADVAAFRAGFPQSCVLQNAMASTETRTYAQYFVPSGGLVESPVPIGWPVAGKEVHLLDGDGAPVPEGSEGEIAVRSRYLADGYANDPRFTATKFLPQPDGTTLYRTGDRGLFQPDGSLLFLGRTDFQAKIRGNRVELEHVAQTIGLHPQVADSAVIACADPAGNNRLVAYVVSRPQNSVSESALRDFLRDRLPEYALPSTIVHLPELPLNANFKVDRRRLPPPSPPGREDGAPASRTIQILRDIWKDVLQRSDVADDRSFVDLGGDSLGAIRVLVAIHEHFGRDLSSAIFQHGPTLKLLAQYVDDAVGNEALPGSSRVFQAAGEGCPFFFVAGLGGSTGDYDHLAARIASRHPAYGLHARSRFAVSPEVSVESIAASHVAELERLVPGRGKVVLVGHSFGGTLAFEIARQLRAKGFPDPLPIVIDMPAINAAPRTRWQRRWDILCNTPAWAAHEIANFRPRASLLRANGNLRRMIGPRAGQTDADKFDPRIYFGRQSVPEAYQAFLTGMYRAMLAYMPGKYEGRMVLLRASVPTLRRRIDRTMGWQAVAAGGIEVHSIPGKHDDCMSERHCPALASVLLRCAADLEQGRSPGSI